MKFQHLFITIFRILLVIIICLNLSKTFFSVRNLYLRTDYRERYPILKKAYYDSIYANKKGKWINDEILYAFAGGAFMQGVSPVLINPEVPPLGRYIIGVSTVLFYNENTLNGLFAILTLLFTYLVAKQVTNSSNLALLPVFFLSFESIFKNQIINTPLLDIMQAVFLLACFYSFNKSLKSSRRLLFIFLANICLGCFISTKFYILGLPIVLASLAVFTIHNLKTHLRYYLITLPFAVGILLLSYAQAIITGYPLSDFLGIQKWILLYNSGHLHFPFSVWQLLLFNRWHVWWGNVPVISDSQWFISWPILTISTLLAAISYFKGKFRENRNSEILFIWAFAYLLLLSISDASTRYFVILIPVLYILTTYFLKELYSVYINKYQVTKNK